MPSSKADPLLFVDPVFQQRVWGGDTLRQWFGEEATGSATVGEAWVISGLPGMAGTIRGGSAAGMTVDEAWRAGLVTGSQRSDDFPLLVKFLDAAEWLSVQVHPDDGQAERIEGQPRGKSECWYVVEGRPDAELVVGHEGDEQGMRRALGGGRVDELLIRHRVEPGDFFMVPAGTVHAVGAGVVVYEVQQSSDTTYRLYDYERLGLDGQPRQLHVDKALSVINSPFDRAASVTAAGSEVIPGGRRRLLVEDPHFTVTEYVVTGRLNADANDDYCLGSVVAGRGSVSCGGPESVAGPGTSFICPRGAGPLTFDGDMIVVVTKPGPLA